MNVNDMIKLVIGVVVGILMVSAILVPTIGASVTDVNTKIGTNAAYEHTLENVTDTDVTINITYTAESNSNVEIAYGDKTYSITPVAGDSASKVLFYSDVCQLFINRVDGNGTPVYGIKSTTYTGILSQISSVFTYDASTKDVSLTVSGNETYTATVEKLAYVYAGTDGKYGLFKPAHELTVSADEDIEIMVLAGWWGVTYVTYSASAEEWYNSDTTKIEGLAITADPTPTEYSAEFSMAWTDNENDSYTRSGNLAYEYNNGTDDVSGTANNPMIIAPIEYTYYEETSIGTMLDIIPLLVTVGIIVGIVGVAFSRRD